MSYSSLAKLFTAIIYFKYPTPFFLSRHIFYSAAAASPTTTTTTTMGTISDERAVKVPASEAWKLYSTLQLAKIVQEALPGLISKIDVVEGDGAVGTILELFFPPGMESGLKSYKEKFTVVDNEKRVKETEVVEGGYLDLGFTLYRVRFEVIEVEGKEKECITRSTIEFELKPEAAANAAVVSIQPLTTLMQVAADNLERSYNHNN